MNEGTRQDMTISGSGAVGGGLYREIRINGSGVINGDVDCLSLTIHGAGTLKGALTAGAVTLYGSGKLERLSRVDKLHIKGEGSVQGEAAVKELRVDGAAKFEDTLTAETIDIHGTFSARECNAERFTAAGGFTIAGLLNADTIEVTLHGDCRAREIGGSAIRVAPAKHRLAGLKKILHTLLTHTLRADTIEADDIYLEHTTANVVRGKRITLGPGCVVALVEYTETCETAKDSRVQQQTQIVR